jgi:sulfatase maturation enzyme AslB (radical SAM superfamily)
MKTRLDRNGLHVFDRVSGLNILIDEVSLGAAQPSSSPRYVSIALTNACDLACSYCYAPKHAATLSRARLQAWLLELDANGCLGVGFGGGEPTLYRGFSSLCRWMATETRLAVSFTTHGHRLTAELCDELSGAVHFVRVSMDGVGLTYESLRRRAFSDLTAAISRLRTIAPFGINFVVNARTVHDLDAAIAFAETAGAVELLLLPQRATAAVPAADDVVVVEMERWIATAPPTVRLAVSESGASDALALARPFDDDSPLDATAHIDATAVLKASSFDINGVPITGSVMAALSALRGSVQA